jgi:ribokinase
LAGEALFLTALGNDDLGRRSLGVLAVLGVRIVPEERPVPQRRGFVHIDERGERTITVVGDRMGPMGDDDLPWDELAGYDAVYVTAGDAGAVRHARQARVLVGTARDLPTLKDAGVRIDALVASANDPGEAYEPGDLDPEPELLVRTAGSAGGTWETSTGETGRWAATPLPGPIADAYGCGDSFAAGLTYALGAGMAPAEAVQVAARCGAACLTGQGPYSAQLTKADL